MVEELRDEVEVEGGEEEAVGRRPKIRWLSLRPILCNHALYCNKLIFVSLKPVKLATSKI